MTPTYNFKSLWCIGFVLLALLIVSQIASASSYLNNGILFYGETNYSEVTLPNNSYVHQGENLTQGNYYDLSGVYGFSGVLAWWEDGSEAGTTYPDKTFNLNSLKLRHVYIDSQTWPVGSYYQFDSAKYDDDDFITSSYFGHGNCYAFYVAPAQFSQSLSQTTNVTKEAEVEVNIGGNVTKIRVTYTQQESIAAEPTITPENQHTIVIPTTTQEKQLYPASDVVDQYGNKVNAVPGDLQKITPSAPMPLWVSIIGCIAGMFVLKRWNKK